MYHFHILSLDFHLAGAPPNSHQKWITINQSHTSNSRGGGVPFVILLYIFWKSLSYCWNWNACHIPYILNVSHEYWLSHWSSCDCRVVTTVLINLICNATKLMLPKQTTCSVKVYNHLDIFGNWKSATWEKGIIHFSSQSSDLLGVYLPTHSESSVPVTYTNSLCFFSNGILEREYSSLLLYEFTHFTIYWLL